MAQKSVQLQDILKDLCHHLTGKSGEELLSHYKIAANILGSSFSSEVCSEVAIAEKIKKKFVRQGRDRDAVKFADRHRQLQKQSSVIHSRAALFQFLLAISRDSSKPARKVASAFALGLGDHATSTPFVDGGKVQQPPHTPSISALHMTGSSGATSGISTIHGSLDSREPTPYSVAPSYMVTPANAQPIPPPSLGPRGGHATLRRLHYHSSSGDATSGQQAAAKSRSATSMSHFAHSHSRGDSARTPTENTSSDIPESVLIRELLYVCLGIECKYIQYAKNKEDGFVINPQAGISKPMRLQLARLVECGWLYNKLQRFITTHSGEKAYGRVGQSFCLALDNELQALHKLLSVLKAQLNQEEDFTLGPETSTKSMLTLKKLQVWFLEPIKKFKKLAVLIDACKAKKGGALASVVHTLMQDGDPYIAKVIGHALAHAARPIMVTIMKWIYDGELEDRYHEFFVADDPTVKDDRLWQDKYHIRKGMVPSFITEDQARRILLSGKSINFLRQVCRDNTSIRDLEVVKVAETNKVESMFQQDQFGDFSNMIDTVYRETSQHLLQVMREKYHFLDHLKAMRRYLLLGQGDFIRHLMDLLEEDLARPANELYLHNLTGILETAVRATNAQYDEPDILERLDVRLLEVSPGDTGWDVFSLDYHVDGPIRTVFTPECVLTYLRVFNFLWRAKRMEYTLAGIWKGQMSNARLLRSIPELGPILHQCHVIACEMVHFVQQVQYYINFEVMECSWDELSNKVREAKDLDEIITAHQHFLDTIITRSLLDQNSMDILAQLRTIFDLIIKFQGIQDKLYEEATNELIMRRNFEEKKITSTKKGGWGLTEQDEDIEMKRRKNFKHSVINPISSQLRVHAPAYQNMVQKFLEMLAAHEDLNLRFLSFRLDFNEYYREKNPKLKSPRPVKTVKKTNA